MCNCITLGGIIIVFSLCTVGTSHWCVVTVTIYVCIQGVVRCASPWTLANNSQSLVYCTLLCVYLTTKHFVASMLYGIFIVVLLKANLFALHNDLSFLLVSRLLYLIKALQSVFLQWGSNMPVWCHLIWVLLSNDCN